jgi:hypothetical protein
MTLIDPSLRVRMFREVIAQTHRWNRIVAKRAVQVDTDHPRYVKVLHPTKGWRFIGKERLGL